MLRLLGFFQAALDLVPRHRAVAAVVVWIRVLDTGHHRPADLHRGGAIFLLHSVSTVVSGAALDDVNRGIGHELEHISCLEPDVLHA